MKKIIAVILSFLLAGPVFAQWGGMYTARPRTPAGTAVGSVITAPCTVFSGILFNASTPCSANLTFSAGVLTLGGSAAGQLITVDATSGSRGRFGSPAWDSSYVEIGNATLSDTAANSALYQSAVGATVLNTAAGQLLDLRRANVSIMAFSATAGAGPAVTAGTATTDVAALSATQTWNNAAVAFVHEKHVITDTASAAGSLAVQYLGGAAGNTNLLKLAKNGDLTIGVGNASFENVGISVPGLAVGYGAGMAGNQINVGDSGISSIALAAGMGIQIGTASAGGIQFSSSTGSSGSKDANISRISAGLIGVGTGAAGAVDGTIAATNYRVAAKPVILGTAPTIASGGCTSPTVTNTNGTAYFTIDVGTSCSGSQPVVFTLPAATTGWVCSARNVTNAAISVPAQSGAISTTSVTITNYARTTGLATAWTNADDVTVTCMGG